MPNHSIHVRFIFVLVLMCVGYLRTMCECVWYIPIYLFANRLTTCDRISRALFSFPFLSIFVCVWTTFIHIPMQEIRRSIYCARSSISDFFFGSFTLVPSVRPYLQQFYSFPCIYLARYFLFVGSNNNKKGYLCVRTWK